MGELKVALFGSGGVGKSSLTGQFVSHMWTERYDPTIEDAFRKEVFVNGRECVLEILDTAGIEQFIGMRDHQMRDRQGFILVYDITNPASVDDLTDLYTQILRNKLINPSAIPTDTPLLPLVLVGNKLDLAMERKVSRQRGKELAELWKCPHYETSAKTRTNVDEIFLDLVRQIVVEREEAVRARKASGSGRSVDGIAGEGGKQEDEDDSVGMGCCVIS